MPEKIKTLQKEGFYSTCMKLDKQKTSEESGLSIFGYRSGNNVKVGQPHGPAGSLIHECIVVRNLPFILLAYSY